MSLALTYDFHGKTALITRASSGLGEQFARCLHARRARVILASRRLDKLREFAKELGNAKAIKMDVADKNSVVSCFAELEKAGEKIDIYPSYITGTNITVDGGKPCLSAVALAKGEGVASW